MENFIQLHSPQLLASGVPELYWSSLYEKLRNQTFDAGTSLQLLRVDYGDDEATSGRNEEDPVYAIMTTKPIMLDDPNSIYLIDHAFTFRLDGARKQLMAVPGLLNRMCSIMGVSDSVTDIATKADLVLTSMWRFVNTYSVNAQGLAVENRMPIWYIMDEVGSAIHHSDESNFRLVPFLHLNERVTYSLLFPVADVKQGDLVTRDFVQGHTDPDIRSALLLPWRYTDFKEQSFEQKEPSVEYFLQGRIEETLPMEDTISPTIDPNRPLRVYTEYKLIKENLTDTAFEIVNDEQSADILWYTKHFKGYKEFSEHMPDKFVNQFPFENVLTIKDLLCIISRRTCKNTHNIDTLETYPKWLPTTYNLKTEIVQFASYYQTRTEKNLDNHWIIKPYNLARGLDTHITNNISQIIRHSETGPKIAQKYIENPVLFFRSEIEGKVKFDIRYIVLLKGVDSEPDLYIYNNFFLRFANRPYELNNFDQYEQHFTVMNYLASANLRHMKCDEFKNEWSNQYPDHKWESIEDQVCQVFKELFSAATKKAPPCGIGKSPQSRAVYAADLMLAWENGEMQVKLLEVNWTPDCQRACQYYKNFYNDIFKLLFLNDYDENLFRKIG